MFKMAIARARTPCTDFACWTAVALAFSEQVAEQPVPTEETDMNMDILILPGEAIPCSPEGKSALQGQ